MAAILPLWTAGAAFARSAALSSAPLNPEYIKYRDALKTGAAKAPVPGGQSLGYIPSPLDLSHDTGKKPLKSSGAPALSPAFYPSSYDLRGLGKVSAVKNQSTCGACWTFSTMAALESRLLTGESRDFSENNLKDTSGFDNDPCAGGNNQMATSYLARWSGPLSETADPYNVVANQQAPVYPSASALKHIQEALFLPDRSGAADNDTIKEALTTYGAVATSIRWEGATNTSSSYYNSTTHAYAYYGSGGTNHAVAIVGWNDTYDKSNFATPAPGNGAFIVKNSWGTGWGESGYFYLSYYDSNIVNNTVYPVVEETTRYDSVYQYDPLGCTTHLGFESTTGWFSNIFTAAAGNTKLKAVSFYTAAMNASYTVRIYRGVTTAPDTGTLMLTQTGVIPYSGYHTISLNTEVPLSGGQKFSVVVEADTPGYDYPIPIEAPIPGVSSEATAGAGQSYVSSDGSAWDDLTAYPQDCQDCNVNIKAFAVNIIPTPADFSGTARGVSSITWTWDSSAGATQYNFYPSSGGAAIILASPVLTQIELSTNTQYSARVSASATSESELTAAVAVYTLAAPPTGFSLVTAQNTSLTVRWGANENPAGTQYRLDYWAAGGSTTSVQGAAAGATVSGLTLSTTYYLRVGALNGDNILTASSSALVAQTLPAPPGNFSGAGLGASSITWTWNGVAGAAQYKFYPSTGGAAITLTAPALTQTDLSTNTAYGARVSAVNSGGEGAKAAEVSIYTLAAPPTGYSLVSAQDTSLEVHWGANENPAGTQYRLDYWAAGGSTASVQGAAAGATVSGLTPSTTYYLRVSALNGNNIPTASGSTFVVQTLPPAPGNFSGAALGVSSVTWTWNGVPGASQYNFYPSTGGAAIALAAPALTQTDLSTNTAYGARVSAVNSGGEGALAATTTIYTLAAAPASPELASVWLSSAAALWSPAQNPAGTVFTLELSVNNFSSVSASSRTTLSAAAFSALLPDTSYYFRVKAENGEGLASAYTQTLTTVTFAAAPSGLTLTQVSSATLSAVWLRNLNPSDTQFELSLSSAGFVTNISTPLPFAPASAVTQLNLTGLTAETTYYARVRARNRSGFTTEFSTAAYFLPTDLTQSVDPALQAELTFANAFLTIPPRAFSQTLAVTMQAPGAFPAETSLAASLTGVNSGVEITTDKNISPVKKLTLTLTYTPTQAAGLNEAQFLIARYEPARAVWIPYPSTPDPAANRVTAYIDHLSLFQIMMAAPAGSLSAAAIKIFPNPVRPSRGQTMKFTGLPAAASIKIYTFQGELVRGLTADASGIAQWDGRNSAGRPAAGEVYLALIKAGGDTKTLKVMVER